MARHSLAGSFWKRFDKLKDGEATGRVVNYESTALPGYPPVGAPVYPGRQPPVLQEGRRGPAAEVPNAPYKLVYDTIKVIDEQMRSA